MSMEKLLMHVALVDQITKPLQGITKEVQSSMEAGKQGMQNMATGGAGLVAAGFAIQNALMPAIEMDRKLGEVASLGVVQSDLDDLAATALKFSAEYGKSATDFVDSSYKIKSAISSLQGDELSHLTHVSGVLAAATKADSTTITSYMGQMHKIFNEDAQALGNAAWAEKIAGQTAKVVQLFNTEGKEMASAFQNLQSIGAKNGVAMEEQFAVLGTLQAITGSGARAGTQYSAFLQGVAKAQGTLGDVISFTGEDGSMRSVIDIMEQLKSVYGDTLDLSAQADLKKAFGGQQAVDFIMNMMDETDGLSQSIAEVTKAGDFSTAEMMAGKMTDQWERLEASWFAVRAAVFGAILPSINAIVGSMANGLVYITGWTDEFPWLAEILGVVAIAGLSLGGVVATLSLAMGIGQMMSAGWAVTMTGLNSIMKLLRITTIASTAAAWLFNAALWANPITWVVAGIALLIGGVAAAIYWWDDLTAAFKDTAWFDVIAGAIEGIVDLLNMIPGVDIELGSKVDTPEVSAAVQAERNAPTSIQPMAFDAPEMPTGNGGSIAEYKQPGTVPTLPPSMVQNVTTTHKPQGGNMNSYGDVYITAPNGITPDQLAEWDELNAG
ncbi:phage tail tape measure protein [Vibrio scophthalmi]|uniref:phage tail tape measure protein n=1 Tax=Vibrio scophthalmi TaxID=45658 RepID=UPI002FF14F74